MTDLQIVEIMLKMDFCELLHLLDTYSISNGMSCMFTDFRCIEHHLCNGDGEIITDGGDLFSLRNPFNVGNSKCPGFTEVCCRKEEFRGIPIGGTVTVKAPSKKCKQCHYDGYVGTRI